MQPSTAQATDRSGFQNVVLRSLRSHWPEYLIEAWGLGMFMISACIFTVLLEHPSSALHWAIDDSLLRRAVMGLAMGGTAVAIICSPWGQRSGAHLNPAVTLTYWLRGKIEPADGALYMVAQFAGGAAGVQFASFLIGPPVAHMAVNHAVTAPGHGGIWTAFGAEFLISFLLMECILVFSNHRKMARYTPYAAGILIALYITVEAPLSGMSMNPARSAGSSFAAAAWPGWWIYFTAPPLGMALASWVYIATHGSRAVLCAKLHHHNTTRCIFRCEHWGAAE